MHNYWFLSVICLFLQILPSTSLCFSFNRILKLSIKVLLFFSFLSDVWSCLPVFECASLFSNLFPCVIFVSYLLHFFLPDIMCGFRFLLSVQVWKFCILFPESYLCYTLLILVQKAISSSSFWLRIYSCSLTHIFSHLVLVHKVVKTSAMSCPPLTCTIRPNVLDLILTQSKYSEAFCLML